MIDINKEAEEYAKKMWGVYFDDKHPDVGIEETQGEICIKDFIAGHNSKATQAKVLQAQIEENRSVLTMLKIHGNGRNRLPVLMRVNELEEQLKQLENE